MKPREGRGRIGHREVKTDVEEAVATVTDAGSGEKKEEKDPTWRPLTS